MKLTLFSLAGLQMIKITIFKWVFPITVLAVDKFSMGVKVVTGSRIIEDARRQIRLIIRDNPRDNNYYIQIMSEPTKVKRVTGSPVYEIDMRFLFEQTQGLS